MANESLYLGVGIKRPLQLVNGKPVLAYGVEALQSGLIYLLDTQINSKFFLREYGSRLNKALFQSNNDVTNALIRQFVLEAINTYEKRVKFDDITFVNLQDQVECTIYCKILQSNEIVSFVYPFYKEIVY